jgi:hypothetical protein
MLESTSSPVEGFEEFDSADEREALDRRVEREPDPLEPPGDDFGAGMLYLSLARTVLPSLSRQELQQRFLSVAAVLGLLPDALACAV